MLTNKGEAKEELDLDGKIFKQESYETTTYWRFGKLDNTTNDYKCFYVHITDSQKMINTVKYNYKKLYIRDLISKCSEISKEDFWFIMRQLINDYVDQTKKDLGLEDNEPIA